MNYQLRNYQQDAVDSILKWYKNGVRKQVAVLATGLGKTIIFSHLVSRRNAETGKKALILAHREELLLQAKDKLQQVNRDLRIGIEQADKIADHSGDDVVIASVSTIGRTGSPRLMQFNPQEYSTIIIDEAHHASAESYKTILRHFGVLKNENDTNSSILLLGVTATPKRNDNQGIEQIFDKTVYEYNIIDGINNSWLSRIRAFKINTTAEIDSVRTNAGDFNIDELKQAVNTPARNNLIVQTYKEKADGKQALVFAVDVEHTRDLCLTFQDHGIEAAYITGETDKKERTELLSAFKAAKIPVMVNALVLTEGYDNERISHILMARPTKSGILYQQMIGRGTRVHSDKPHLTIIDFVDNTSRHALQTAGSLIGLEGTIDFNGGDILDARKQLDELLDKRPHYDLNKLKIVDIDALLEEVDIMQQKEAAQKEELYIWHSFNDGMRMHSSKYRYYLVEQTITGQYELSEYYNLTVTKKPIDTFLSKSEAMRFADSLLRKSYSGMLNTVGYESEPRFGNELPSEAQIALLRELGADEHTIMFLDKRQASILISALKKQKRW
jgi:superfamily II DNA or RNA helicase